MGCSRWAKRASTSSMSGRGRGGPGTAGPSSRGASVLSPPLALAPFCCSRPGKGRSTRRRAHIYDARGHSRRGRTPAAPRAALEAGRGRAGAGLAVAASGAGPGVPETASAAGGVADMAGSRLPRQLFLQGVAAVFVFAFASLYTQIPGEGAEEGTPPSPRPLSAHVPAGTPPSGVGGLGME